MLQTYRQNEEDRTGKLKINFHWSIDSGVLETDKIIKAHQSVYTCIFLSAGVKCCDDRSVTFHVY